MSTRQNEATYPSEKKKKMSRHRPWIFFLVFTCLSVSSDNPLWHAPEFGAHKLLSLTSSWLVFYWRIHLLASCRRLSKMDTSSPLTSACPVVSRTLSVSCAHAQTIFRPLFLVIFNYHECIGLVIRWLLADLFIYSSNFLLAVQLRYTTTTTTTINYYYHFNK